MSSYPRQVVIDGPPIDIGYSWSMNLTAEASSPLFPSGVTIVSHVRENVESQTILSTLTTENGGLTRVSDTEITITIPEDDTIDMPVGSVVLDLVRTDVDPNEPMRIRLTIPTQLPVTRGVS